MISRRDKLLNYPSQLRHYEEHLQKVCCAKPVIDMRSPPAYMHIVLNQKKRQLEKERMQTIETENVRLLQQLGKIMRTKRMENIWLQPRPHFLNRVKMFETRPHSSLPKLSSVYSPAGCNGSGRQAPKSAPPALRLPNGKIARRCPTCCGCSERFEIEIPEERTPWQPMQKSCNKKLNEVVIPKRCLHCGYTK